MGRDVELNTTPRKIPMCESLGPFGSDAQRFLEQYILLIKRREKSDFDP